MFIVWALLALRIKGIVQLNKPNEGSNHYSFIHSSFIGFNHCRNQIAWRRYDLHFSSKATKWRPDWSYVYWSTGPHGYTYKKSASHLYLDSNF